MINPIQLKREIIKSNIINSFDNTERIEVEDINEFVKAISTDGFQVFDRLSIEKYIYDLGDIEKARKNLSGLVKKVITDKNGKKQTVWVKSGQKEAKVKVSQDEKDKYRVAADKSLAKFLDRINNSPNGVNTLREIEKKRYFPLVNNMVDKMDRSPSIDVDNYGESQQIRYYEAAHGGYFINIMSSMGEFDTHLTKEEFNKYKKSGFSEFFDLDNFQVVKPKFKKEEKSKNSKLKELWGLFEKWENIHWSKRDLYFDNVLKPAYSELGVSNNKIKKIQELYEENFDIKNKNDFAREAEKIINT